MWQRAASCDRINSLILLGEKDLEFFGVLAFIAHARVSYPNSLSHNIPFSIIIGYNNNGLDWVGLGWDGFIAC